MYMLYDVIKSRLMIKVNTNRILHMLLESNMFEIIIGPITQRCVNHFHTTKRYNIVSKE